ncbi:Uncharacterised protein [Vibrio cholerae]|nr:Uncharacterised protein [Vibrio cholerae]
MAAIKRCGVSSLNGTTQSTAPRPANTAIRRSVLLTGRPGPFKRFTDSSVFTATIKRSPSSAAWLR